MTSFLEQNWIAVILISIALLCLVKLWHKSDKRQYSKIITRSKKDAQYCRSKRSKNRDFTPEQKIAIYRRDKGECQICKAKGYNAKTRNAPKGFIQHIVYYWSHIPGFGFLWLNLLAEIDHIILNSWNGPNDEKNGRVAHRVCNRKRPWRKPDKDFYEEVRRRGQKVYLG